MNRDRGLDSTGTTLANGVDTHVPRWLGRPTPRGRRLNRLNRCMHATFVGYDPGGNTAGRRTFKGEVRCDE